MLLVAMLSTVSKICLVLFCSRVPGPEPADDAVKLLRLVNSQEGGFATAPEIEPHTSVGEKQTRNRLEDLFESGLLKRRKVGSTNVYWLSDEGEAKLAESGF